MHYSDWRLELESDQWDAEQEYRGTIQPAKESERERMSVRDKDRYDDRELKTAPRITLGFSNNISAIAISFFWTQTS